MKVTDFIDGTVTYDQKRGQGLYVNGKILAVFASFPIVLKKVGDYYEAREAQDEIGNFVAAAINEKLEREKA